MIEKRTGHALVLGCGASGIAAARLMLKHGWKVTVIDEDDGAPERIRGAHVDARALTFRTDVDGMGRDDVDTAVVSPGIPRGHAWLAALNAAGVPVIPEFEFGLHHMPGSRVVAVTGSNGKSSAVKWMADALVLAGRQAVAAGNYGLPPCDLACKHEHPDVIVLELSSFQLEQSVAFRPDIGVLLNLSPNHLDRHASYEEYRDAKARLFAFSGDGDPAFIHAPAAGEFPALAQREGVRLFGEDPGLDLRIVEGQVHLGEGRVIDLSGTWWGVRPQAVNAVAAAAVLELLGVDSDTIRESAEWYEPLPHRHEEFARCNGVVFIDDSKASTLTALAAAVSSGSERKHLIAGGILKEDDPTFVKEILVDYCAFVYCIGRVGEKLARAWGDAVPCEVCGDLETAVKLSFERAKPGETVLLSPGCSSFDQFKSYAHRGDRFKELVRDRIG